MSKSTSKTISKSMSKSTSKSMSKSTSNNANNTNRIDKCISTYCKNVYPKKVKQLTKNMPKMMKTLKNVLPKEMKKSISMMSSKEKKQMYSNFKENMKEHMKKQMKEKTKKESNNHNEKLNKICIKSNCNPECKNTIFQKGTKIPESVFIDLKEQISTQLKNTPKMIPKAYKLGKKTVIEMRKNIFGKKTNVLKGDFHETLSPKIVRKLKQEGAISGCSVGE
jgi:hypothetical protein